MIFKAIAEAEEAKEGLEEFTRAGDCIIRREKRDKYNLYILKQDEGVLM
jgi:hypothetical protein